LSPHTQFQRAWAPTAIRSHLEKAKLCDLLAVAAAADAVPGESTTSTLERAILPMTSTTAEAAVSRRAEVSEIVYRPVWDVRHEVLSTYLSRRRSTRPGARSYADSPDEAARVDIEALRNGIEVLGELYENNFRLRLSVPASFKAISSVPRLRSYVELCRTIPEHLRRFLAFELTDLPAGVPHAWVAELATHLRPFFGLVNATVDWWRCDFSQYANIGIRIVNAVMTNEPTTTTTLAHLIQRIDARLAA
jgi:hypothetical protein